MLSKLLTRFQLPVINMALRDEIRVCEDRVWISPKAPYNFLSDRKTLRYDNDVELNDERITTIESRQRCTCACYLYAMSPVPARTLTL
jgi:hypothetical protein